MSRKSDWWKRKEPNTRNVYNLQTTYDNSRHDHSTHQVGDNHNITNNHYHGAGDDQPRSPEQRLVRWVSKGAAHDSTERGTDAPKCHEETRKAVQGEVLSHVDPGGAESMLWLSGPAGAGKTAIMGSIADACHKKGWLAGSFFFSTSSNVADRCSKRYLIPTLVYQFFQLKIPGLRDAILASIEDNPLVFDKRLEEQVNVLLLGPLRVVLQGADLSTWPKAILVDGVDECAEDKEKAYETEDDRRRSREDNQREVLSALAQAANDPSFPFRILIASRPEIVISHFFRSLPDHSTKQIFLDEKYTPEADVELYARASLSEIGLRHGLGGDWFSDIGKERGIADVPKHLAEESSGQFVYAATVIRFVQGNSGSPHKQLKRVLSWRRGDTSKPFAALDALYTGILRSSHNPALAVGFISASNHTSFNYTVLSGQLRMTKSMYMHYVFQSERGQLAHVLGPLSSLVRVIDSSGRPDFHLYHKSLLDFLKDPERSGELHVKDSQVDDFISDRHYEILRNRGPQVPPPTYGVMLRFLTAFCSGFPRLIRLSRKYTAEDVDWWVTNLPEDFVSSGIAFAYTKVHEKCGKLSCKEVCDVWREGIIRYAEANGWRVPTMQERIQDRFQHFNQDRINMALHPPGWKPPPRLTLPLLADY